MMMKWSVMPKTHAALMMRDQIGKQVEILVKMIKVLLEVLHTVYTTMHNIISAFIHLHIGAQASIHSVFLQLLLLLRLVTPFAYLQHQIHSQIYKNSW